MKVFGLISGLSRDGCTWNVDLFVQVDIWFLCLVFVEMAVLGALICLFRLIFGFCVWSLKRWLWLK